MKCPIDGTELVMTDRQGIEIDYCPQCRGIWLDRGELDKIIERANGLTAQTAPNAGLEPRTPASLGKRKNDEAPYGYDDDDRYDDDYRRQHPNQPYQRRKKNFLEEMFDIFD
jgi:Zn-finger nucleic acid-binding protein